MCDKEEKQFWQIIAKIFFVISVGLCIFVGKQAKMEYYKNLRISTRQYYQNGINQLNIQYNTQLAKQVTEPIKIIINK